MCRIAERQVHGTVTGLPLATCEQTFPELRLTVVTSAGPYSAEKHCLFGLVINERSVLSHWSKASHSICQGSPWLAKKKILLSGFNLLIVNLKHSWPQAEKAAGRTEC